MNNIELITDLIGQAENLTYNSGNTSELKLRSKMIITKIFGKESGYITDLNRIRFSPIITTTGSARAEQFINSFNNGKSNLISLLRIILEDIMIDQTSKKVHDKVANKVFQIIKNGDETENINTDIFIVHGHNETMKQSVARMLEKLKLNPIILHELPNKGKTIIEKFTENSNVGFAIVLLSADDIAYSKNSDIKNAKNRARQNVILELGYFLGKLGRERVLALYEDNSQLEIPSDYDGVLFVPFDNYGRWKFDLVRELRAVKYDVDANEILKL